MCFIDESDSKSALDSNSSCSESFNSKYESLSLVKVSLPPCVTSDEIYRMFISVSFCILLLWENGSDTAVLFSAALISSVAKQDKVSINDSVRSHMIMTFPMFLPLIYLQN